MTLKMGRERAPGGPSADQILEKYIQAVGGAAACKTLSSFIAKGLMRVLIRRYAPVPAESMPKPRRNAV